MAACGADLVAFLRAQAVDPRVIDHLTGTLGLQYVGDLAYYWTEEELDSSALSEEVGRIDKPRLRAACRRAREQPAAPAKEASGGTAPECMEFIFVSGCSGAGKTTICNVLVNAGYKIFDGDIWCAGGDPINQVDAPVTMEMVKSRAPAMAKAVTDAISVGRTKMGKGEPVAWEVWETFYSFMCEAVKRMTAQNGHRRWVIPFAVYRVVERDLVRRLLSNAGVVKFVLLNVPEAVLADRVYQRTVNKAKDQGMTVSEYMARFQPGKTMEEVLDGWRIRRSGFEPKGEREPRTFQIDVSKEMTPEMVRAEAERRLGLSEGGAVWYFATGSMMNPGLLEGRSLRPIKSKPARLIDFKLQFLGSSGFAANVPEKGSSAHGVLHLMPPEAMEQIVEEERGYDRATGTAPAYDGGLNDSQCPLFY